MYQIIVIRNTLVIFIFLSLIITLIPPFEFGNEIVSRLDRLYYSDTSNGSDFHKLPIKQYDFLFNSNKKNFVLNNQSLLLQRKLLTGEMVIEYILAILVSLVIGYIMQLFKSKRGSIPEPE